MKTLVAIFALLLAFSVRAADPASFSLSHIKISEAVEIMYSQVLKTPFVIQSDVLADERMVSFRFNTGSDARQEIGRFLTTVGLAVKVVNGVDVIGLQKEIKPEKTVFVYRPKYRDVSYLIELMRGLFTEETLRRQGRFTAHRSQSVRICPPASRPDNLRLLRAPRHW